MFIQNIAVTEFFHNPVTSIDNYRMIYGWVNRKIFILSGY